jgi:hypothetical protein
VGSLEPQIWSLKKPVGPRLSPSPGTSSAPDRFPTSDCARNFWGAGGAPNAGACPPAARVVSPGGAAVRVHQGSLSIAVDGRGLPHVRSLTVGPPWGNDRELAAALLLLGRRLLRLAVGAPIFLARAVPLWSETFDFGGQRAAARTRARTPHRQADQRQNQRDARPVAGDAVEALVALGDGVADCALSPRDCASRRLRGHLLHEVRNGRLWTCGYTLIGMERRREDRLSE